MKILTVHNVYQQPGGEDVVFEAEGRLLSRYGQDVVAFREDNASRSAWQLGLSGREARITSLRT